MTSGSKITTGADDLLDNVHPGAILREDFLIGSEIAIDEVGRASGLPIGLLEALLQERAAIDANTDLRLGRYFGMSEGFFLKLQIDYDLEEERRIHGEELDRIKPRAA